MKLLGFEIVLFQRDLSLFLPVFERAKFLDFDQSILKEKYSSIDLGLCYEKLNLDYLFDYQVFPKNVMRFLGQWQTASRQMQVGDIIVQEVSFLLFRLVFAVKVIALIQEPERQGFVYQTLLGHVEQGTSAFWVESGAGDTSKFVIHTFSRSCLPVQWLFGKLAELYQDYCTQKALLHFKQNIENQRKAGE